jgi:hypothetical protein
VLGMRVWRRDQECQYQGRVALAEHVPDVPDS